MKGGEGRFLVVLSITVCMPDIYIDRVKGDGFFSFRFSNFQSYLCLCLCMRTSVQVQKCVCIL